MAQKAQGPDWPPEFTPEWVDGAYRHAYGLLRARNLRFWTSPCHTEYAGIRFVIPLAGYIRPDTRPL